MKLVRDNIPQIILENGRTPVTETIPQGDMLAHLNKKLQEEVCEYLGGNDIMEVCDIIEVLYAIIDTLGYSKEQIEQMRLAKRMTNGGFSKRILLKEVID